MTIRIELDINDYVCLISKKQCTVKQLVQIKKLNFDVKFYVLIVPKFNFIIVKIIYFIDVLFTYNVFFKNLKVITQGNRRTRNNQLYLGRNRREKLR